MDNKPTRSHLIALLIFVLFWPTLMLIISGDWLWPECWLFAGWFILTMGTIAVYLYFKDPELLMERLRKNGSGNQKAWDKYFIILLRIICIIWFVIMPLDAKRWGWTRTLPLYIKLSGITLLLTASVFLFLSFKDNTFLSPHVRIQVERKQQLVTNGVYRLVRHPMYLSLLLIFAGIPLLLNSYLGLAVSMVVIVLLVFRITGEEKMLMKEFEGYAEYKRKVRFRLIPFLW
jgi:protein-S-isoprenylcysteine O-methyltransferase Ste14